MSRSQYLFSFRGRIGRGRFWFGYLILFGIRVALFGLAALLASFTDQQGIDPNKGASPENIALGAIVVLGFLLTAYIGLAIAAKRCHDRGRSAWFLLIGFIPLLGLWVFVECGILKGEPGPNRFGPDPQGVNVSEVFA